MSPKIKNDHVRRIALAGMMAALSYIGFWIQIPIAVGGEKTAFHLGNTFCVLASLLLGGPLGGLSGAVGMTIADLTTDYVTYAPMTFVLKLCIGLIVGFVAHRVFKINTITERRKLFVPALVSSACGMAFNVIADPVVGYFYKKYVFGIPQDVANMLAKMSAITTFVNAILAVAIAANLYVFLRPIIDKRSGRAN